LISLNKSLIEYPLQFPIKIVGINSEIFLKKIIDILNKHDNNLSEKNIYTRFSKNNKYISITVNLNIKDRKQLDKIYLALSSEPSVKFLI
tara:strand:+ start:100 stop:369 length:270 start_codon:yes stop_codon:yes gene_type:complete